MNYCESSKHSHSFSVRRLPLLFLLLQIKNNIDAIKNATHSEKKGKPWHVKNSVGGANGILINI